MLVTLIALVGAFTGYFLMQSKYGLSLRGDKSADSFPVTGEGSGILKPGSGAWSKQFDKDGNLYYQFKCEMYDPQPDGTVKVTHPVIQFFLSGGQVLQIEGKDGTVRLAYTIRDREGPDNSGVMELTLPTRLLTPGQPAELRVVPAQTGSRRWFGLVEWPQAL